MELAYGLIDENSALESEQEEISYVVLLKDWEISPRHLKLTDQKLGSGKFGVVKQGLYTPSENSSTEVVAVKMLKGAYCILIIHFFTDSPLIGIDGMEYN